MNNLTIDNKPWTTIRFGIGILFIIAGLLSILEHLDDLSISDLLIGFLFTLSGLLNITNDFGMSKSFLRYEDNYLTIKWINKLRLIIVDNAEIRNISFQKFMIVIERINSKSIILKLNSFEKIQKIQIHDFFTEYSRDNDIPIERL